jgi:spore germination protein YaaH
LRKLPNLVYNTIVKREIIITVLILFGALTLGLFGRYLGGIKISDPIVSPFGNSFSVYSFLSEERVEKPDYIVYGFLPYWRLEKIKYLHLDKLTDIAYFGLNINPDGSIKKTTKEGTIDPGYNQWKNNPNLDELIKEAKDLGIRFSLTVISHEDDVSDAFLNCETCWNILLTELTQELDSKKIKDVHLNFEYVSLTDESTADKYTAFVDFINKSLDEKYGDSYVVVSTFGDSFKKPRVTKVQDLEKVADGIFIMAYDFHYRGSDRTGPVSPIGGAGINGNYDISTMLKDHLAQIPPNKLIMGVPYYGYDWLVDSPLPNSRRVDGNDDIGFSKSQTYGNAMELIIKYQPYVQWDALGMSPFFVYNDAETDALRQIYYENEDSLKIKYELIKQNNLAGVGIWALGYDGGYQELWQLLGSEFIMDKNEKE